MKITNSHTDNEGVLHFILDRNIYEKVLLHLRRKQLNPGGKEHFDDEQSEITIEGFTIDDVNKALEDFETAPMKSIQENGLNAVQLALQHSDPFLSAQLLQIVGKGTFKKLPITVRGGASGRIFTPASPIPTDFGKAVLDTLETFSKTPTGQDARFDGMNIHGAMNFWRNFIS
jgi:hypothetical protein